FDNYLAAKMKEQGKSSDYLTYMKAPLYMASWDHAPYPQGEELAAATEAFDKLFQTIQEKTDESGKTLLFSKGEDTVKNTVIEEKDNPFTTEEEVKNYLGKGGRTFHNNSENSDIRVSWKGIRHKAPRDNKDVFRAVTKMESIIAEAKKIGQLPVDESEIGKTRSVNVFYSPVNILGKQYSARMIVKEYERFGKVIEELGLYNMSLGKEKTPSAHVSTSEEGGVYSDGVQSEYKVKDLIFKNKPQDQNLLGITDASGLLFSKANAGQKVPGKVYVDEDTFDDSLRFSLSRNNRKTVDAWLKKREDITDEQRDALVAYLDTMDNPTLQLATAKWYASGVIRIPEDMPKVEQAVAVAGKAKVDPLQYKNPMELIEAHADIRLTEKRINPDDVPTLRRAKEYPEYGIVVYDVEDSDESRENMRRIINTHFGKEASPWCLLQGDGEGNLTEESANYWRHYNAYPKQVAFKDGKLLAFSANSTDEVQWWDRNDEPSEGIPVTRKMPNDALGRTATYNIGADGKLGDPFNIRREYKENGVTIHESWHDNGALAGRREEVDGVLRKKERYYPNGQKRLELNFNEKGERDGLEEEYYKDGTPKARGMWKNNLRVGEWQTWFASGKPHFVGYYNEDGKGDGSATEWYESGKKRKTGSFVNGEKYGEHVIYWENGQVMERSMYSDGKLNGVKESWFENGMPRTKEHFKDGHPHGEILEYEDNGTLVRRKHYKDSRLVGKQEAWYPNGNKYYVANYNEEGKQDGVKEMYGYDGNLSTRYLYKDGNIVEETSYNPNGTKS
ncbi:MAG: hypothetical protein IK119_00100, partial [Bacteroidales bacterium]|nr:hypothetical protein [Bacteroidales bacterium]